jgi:hypothetical protein
VKTVGRHVHQLWIFLSALALILPLNGRALLAQGDAPDPGYDQAAIDPPARVGRVSYLSASVSFHGFDADHWDPAQLNYPITSGLSFWTESGARTRLELGHAVLTLGSGTEVDVAVLDDENCQIVVPQGAVNFRLRRLRPGQSYQFTTPRGTVAITAPGRYHIDAGNTTRLSTLAVLEGAALVRGIGGQLPVAAGQLVTTDGYGWNSIAEPQELDRWSDRAEAPTEQIPAYVSPDMPGASDLGAVGTWRQTPDDGAVWYPPVDRDWAPYRYGHWGYVAPWGWTWIDDAPWGFAPFHYGRWAMIDGRWAWVPGPVSPAPPVYAPALVAFVGGGAALAAGGAVAVGWIPLGPHELYVPPYHTSPAYVHNVNITEVHVTNATEIAEITANRPATTYVNAQAMTVVPGAAMTASRPIAPARVATPAATLAHVAVVAAVPVKPSTATVGASPALVKAVGGSVTPAPSHAGAPGPTVQRQPIPASFIRNLGGRPAAGAPETPTAAAAALHATTATRAPARPAQPAAAPAAQGAPVAGDENRTPETSGEKCDPKVEACPK